VVVVGCTVLFKESYSYAPCSLFSIFRGDFHVKIKIQGLYENSFSRFSQLGPLRGGTIEFALCAVEGKTGKGIIVVVLN
jgi:hypothetical protein